MKDSLAGKFIIFTDGASRGNPGPSAAAFVIKNVEGLVLYQQGIYLGITTNNQAEYQAVKAAFQHIIKGNMISFPTTIVLKADSLLIVKQLSGDYKIKQPKLRELFTEIKSLENCIGQVRYLHINRSENYLADLQANLALDQALGIR